MASVLSSKLWSVSLAVGAGVLLLVPQPTPAQDSYAEINGVRLFYHVEGRGTPLVLIHGWATNSEYWEDQLPAFREKHRVVRYDRRGYGKSGGVPDPSGDPADLDALLTTLGIDAAHVLGHSAGAIVAQGFALSYPRRVKGLLLFGSGPTPGFSLPWNGPDSMPFAEIARVARTVAVDSIWKLFEEHALFSADRLSPEQEARIGRIKKSYRGGDLLNEVKPSRPAEIPTIARLHEIRAPTLVLTADDEIPYLKVVSDAIAYAIPNSTRTVLRGGGHLVNLSQPAAFNAAILDFLTRLDR